MIKAILLDIDGTLMDTNYLHVEAWSQAFEEVGERPPQSGIHYEIGKGSDRLIPEFVMVERRASGPASCTVSSTLSCRIVDIPCPEPRSC